MEAFCQKEHKKLVQVGENKNANTEDYVKIKTLNESLRNELGIAQEIKEMLYDPRIP